MGTNNGNHGKKGRSGRKSAYQEKADAELLNTIFLGKNDAVEIQKLLRTGKYSLKDVFISKAFAGNTRLLEILFKKVFPDNINLGGQKNNPLIDLSDEELNENIKRLQSRIRELTKGNSKENSSD